jgi:hypothetical protein
MPSWPDVALGRAGDLAAVHFNVTRLPADLVSLELSTDAGQPHRRHPGEKPGPTRVLVDVVPEVFGTGNWLLTGSGRGAESVAATLVKPGHRVLANEVYVSGRWWIERFGGIVDERPDLVDPDSGEAGFTVPDHHSLDDVAYVQLTLPPAQLGVHAGTPVSLEQVTRVRHWVDRHLPEVPLVLDASRLWENAAASGTDARACIDVADILLLSASKDIGAPRGGLIVCRDAHRWPELQEAARILEGPNGGLAPDEIQAVVDGLAAVSSGAAGLRQRETERLARELRTLRLPVSSWGCGSLFLDAQAWLPAVPAGELPAQTLLAVIYLLTGWRGLGTSTDESGQRPIVRLAVRDDASPLRVALPAVAELAGQLRSGLRPLPRDRWAPYLQPAEPVDPSSWPAAPLNDLPTPSPWLVGRSQPGNGPERALAEAWGRVAPGAELRTSNATMAALHRRLGGAAGGPVTSSMTTLTLDEYLGGPQPTEGVTAVDVGKSSRWIEAAHTADSADVIWASTDEGGVLAVRRSSPLAAALDEASLFTMSVRLMSTSA